MKDLKDFAHNVPYPRSVDFSMVVIIDPLNKRIKEKLTFVDTRDISWSSVNLDAHGALNAIIAGTDSAIVIPELTISKVAFRTLANNIPVMYVYGLDNAGFDAAKKNYAEARNAQIKELGNYLAEEHGLDPDSKIHKFIFDKAWEKGHSEGRISDIYSELYDEYHEFMKTMEE